jgi:hypothetical protein
MIKLAPVMGAMSLRGSRAMGMEVCYDPRDPGIIQFFITVLYGHGEDLGAEANFLTALLSSSGFHLHQSHRCDGRAPSEGIRVGAAFVLDDLTGKPSHNPGTPDPTVH